VKGKIKIEVKGKVGAGFKPAPTETENSKQKTGRAIGYHA
jgi:hypothetical protein